MVNYNYYLRAHEIKNKLYHEAIKYMQKELDKDEKEKESHVSEGTPAKEDDDDIMSDWAIWIKEHATYLDRYLLSILFNFLLYIVEWLKRKVNY